MEEVLRSQLNLGNNFGLDEEQKSPRLEPLPTSGQPSEQEADYGTDLFGAGLPA